MGLLDEWRYCPRCRAALAGAAARLKCAGCGFVAYGNPAPAASALITNERGELLLARRARSPYAGRWDVPGGFVEENEHPLDTLRRELREETGLAVEPERFLGVWMDTYSEDGTGPGTLNLFWTARASGGDGVPADDVTELRWFRADQLPARDELAFPDSITSVLDAWRQQQP